MGIPEILKTIVTFIEQHFEKFKRFLFPETWSIYIFRITKNNAQILALQSQQNQSKI